MVITRKIKLKNPNESKREILDSLLDTFSECVNYWIDKKGRYTSEFNQECKNKFPNLNSELSSSAYMKAKTIYKSGGKECYKKFILIKGRNIKIENSNIGISWDGKKIWFPFSGQEIPKGIIKGSVIKKENNDWFIFLTIEVSEPKVKKYKRVMGVDVGIAKIATVCDWNRKNVKFFDGEDARNTRNHYHNLRKKLQPKINQGNVYKLLKKLSKKQSNWIKDKNHKVSKEIVKIAVENKRTIALENLYGINKRINGSKKVRRMLSAWSFRQLTNFIEYKARLKGIDVLFVDPRETSRRCPKCGYVSRSNRKSQERFKCNKCHYESNADRVGAINIAQRATDLLASPINYGQTR